MNSITTVWTIIRNKKNVILNNFVMIQKVAIHKNYYKFVLAFETGQISWFLIYLFFQKLYFFWNQTKTERLIEHRYRLSECLSFEDIKQIQMSHEHLLGDQTDTNVPRASFGESNRYKCPRSTVWGIKQIQMFQEHLLGNQTDTNVPRAPFGESNRYWFFM